MEVAARTPIARRIIYWLPRILCLAFIGLLSLFAVDVFSEGKGFSATVLALAIHLMPAILVTLVLALAWRHEVFGTIAFLCLGVLYLVWTSGRLHWSAYAGIAGSLFLIAILFLLSAVRGHRVAFTGKADSH